MLSKAYNLFTDELNQHIDSELPDLPQEIVVSPRTEGNELVIDNDAITVMLVNTEEENKLRNQNQYKVVYNNEGERSVRAKKREVRLMIYLLILSKNESYQQTLKQLSLVISCFQKKPIIEDVDNQLKLIVELITMDFARLNEVWNSMRLSYIPSLLYRLTLVTFESVDTESLPMAEQVQVQVQSEPI
jgi:Pvc16 N-terminal domain